MDEASDPPEVPPGPRKNRRRAAPIIPPDARQGFGRHKFKIESREPHFEVVARLGIEKAKVDHDLRKDFALFVVVMGIVAVATLACLYLVLSNRYAPAIQNAAMALLAGIVSGGVGYATGKSSRAAGTA